MKFIKMGIRPSKLKLALTKLLHWEFWPFELVYTPIILHYFWLSLRARSFFFFSASNPAIDTGGMIGESKISILNSIPEHLKPITIFIENKSSLDTILKKIKASTLSYPMILKPDVGERGFMVEKIDNETALIKYINKIKQNFIIQEYIDYPIELGVFYYRLPTEEKGVISSVVKKEFLTIKGDGKSTVGNLISKYPRAGFQYERLQENLNYEYVPAKDEFVLLEPIGNHCRGTTFIDGRNIIDESLILTFTKISNSIPDFYFGRYDLKCKSIEDLKKGEHIKILELNGAGAEPSHIYNPGYSIFSAWKTLIFHWNILYKISTINHKKGIPYMGLKEAKQKYKNYKNITS